MKKTFKKYRQKFKLLFAIVGVMLVLSSLHSLDIVFNAKIINAYSEIKLETEGCLLQFPKLWDGDMLPNHQLISMTELYLLGINLAIIGLIFLIIAIFL